MNRIITQMNFDSTDIACVKTLQNTAGLKIAPQKQSKPLHNQNLRPDVLTYTEDKETEQFKELNIQHLSSTNK
jgi:hypothetical protein